MGFSPPALVLATLIVLSMLACDKKDDKRDDKKSSLSGIEKDGPKWESDELRDPPMPPPDDPSGPVTGAMPLMTYRFWAEAPGFCQSPGALLEHLDEVIDSEECEAQRRGAGDRAKLNIECISPAIADPGAEASDCEVEYDGRLWAERHPSSESDYTLYAQGSVTRICRTADGRERPRPATPADKIQQRQASKRLEELLSPCRMPL